MDAVVRLQGNYRLPGHWALEDVKARLKHLHLRPEEFDSRFLAWLLGRLNHPTEHLGYDRCTFLDIQRMHVAFLAGLEAR